MNRKLIITKIEQKIWTCLYENELLAELHCISIDRDCDKFSLGNIYVGKVKKVVSNINAAFIEIADGVECYYSITENPKPIFTQKIGKKPLCVGDEILVQITKEALKTKVPTVSSKLSFTGKYAVLTYGDTRVGVSSKIPKEEKEHFMKIAKPFASDEYGIIIRTNAHDIKSERIESEIKELINEYNHVTASAHTRVCFSWLKVAPKAYLTELRNLYQEELTEIIIEDNEVYDEVKQFLEKDQAEVLKKLRFYNDSLLPLHKLYNIEKCIANALKEQVWLKSGAYLVIQPTEALTVIDVNTGKCVSKKADENAILKINLEAATECARQIRLRNLSGIIIIDFINLNSEEHMKQLLEKLTYELSKDSVTTTLVDVTKLQLIEITRKKVRKPLHEAIRD